ncbi:MAG: asparagine synthase (glutamine-hydrolyzing) [Phycisphaerales bacterium JB060]
MCGIAGVINCPPVRREDVQRMVCAVEHRGPDENGVHVASRCTIGHARLAVVDPVNGGQPMCNHDGTVWVVFNGEIYNFVELREELRAKGYHFRSRCDTEVLVHLWRELGPDMLARLNGMFSFFIWDESQDRGMLARDRVGIKPCYLMPYKGGLAFCSEIKGLLTLPEASRAIHPDAFVKTLAFNYCPTEQTCFDAITHMPPGTYILFEGNRQYEPRTYWSWPFEDDRHDASHEEFAALLDDAARMQLRFDVPGGFLLSGGVDSAVVAHHVLAREPSKDLIALSLNIEEPGFGEFDHACDVGRALGITPTPVSVTPDLIAENAVNAVRHAEQPHGDFSFILFYLLCRHAHEAGRIVLFSGDGPDEVTLGFRHNAEFCSNDPLDETWTERYEPILRYTTNAHLHRLLQPDLLAHCGEASAAFYDALAPWSTLSPPEQIAAYECTRLMQMNSFPKGDRMGARWATEGRSLFLDHRVLELFARLPIESRISGGISKRYLKRYAATLPLGVDFLRPKTMPTTPIGEWLKGPLYGWARDIIGRSNDSVFQKKALAMMLDEHRAGQHNHTRPLRVAIMAAIWLESFNINL